MVLCKSNIIQLEPAVFVLVAMVFLGPVDVGKQHYFVVFWVDWNCPRDILMSWDVPLDLRDTLYQDETWDTCHRYLYSSNNE